MRLTLFFLQTSRTKIAVEVDGPKPISQHKESADPLDSISAQVIHSRSEACADSWVPITTRGNSDGHDDQFGNCL